MKSAYRSWLEAQKYSLNTITAQLHRAQRVEQCYGDLDLQYSKDRLETLIAELRYSAADARRNRPNETKIPFEGNIRNNLASYRNAVERYRRFLETAGDRGLDAGLSSSETSPDSLSEDDLGRQFSFERDLQAELRVEIEQLEPGPSKSSTTAPSDPSNLVSSTSRLATVRALRW